MNIAGLPDAADLDQAAATGAKYVRVFAVRSDQLRDLRDVQGHRRRRPRRAA